MECYGKQIWTNLTKDTLHELGIDPPDEAKYRAVKARWDAIAKPLDGMGRFEEITAQIGAVTGDEVLDLSRKAVLIFCADNGIVAEGVSQSGQEVTFAFVNPFSEHKEEACEYLRSHSRWQRKILPSDGWRHASVQTRFRLISESIAMHISTECWIARLRGERMTSYCNLR